jgi:hypothetical protein
MDVSKIIGEHPTTTTIIIIITKIAVFGFAGGTKEPFMTTTTIPIPRHDVRAACVPVIPVCPCGSGCRRRRRDGMFEASG